MSYLDLQQLRTLTLIARTGSFSLAAQKLFKTQSAITHQMHALEASLGVALFERQGRARVLNEDGRRMLRYAEQMLALNEEVFLRYHGQDREKSIRLGSPHDTVETLLPSLLRFARKTLPKTRMEVRIERARRLIDLLHAGEVDMIISVRSVPGLDGLILKRTPTVWLCASDYSYEPGASVPLIIAEGSSLYREMALRALRCARIPSTIARLAPDLVAIKAAVRAGMGITPRSIDLLGPNMRALGEAEGLPRLPDVTFHLWLGKVAGGSPARVMFDNLRNAWGLETVASQSTHHRDRRD